MSNEIKQIDENTLDALLYLSRLSPESTNLEVLRSQVDQIVHKYSKIQSNSVYFYFHQ